MKINGKKIENLAKAEKIKFIILFGSYAKGTQRDDSDIDVAISLNNDESVFSTLDSYSNILQRLSGIFQMDSSRIDLTDLNCANLLLRYEVTSGGKLC